LNTNKEKTAVDLDLWRQGNPMVGTLLHYFIKFLRKNILCYSADHPEKPCLDGTSGRPDSVQTDGRKFREHLSSTGMKPTASTQSSHPSLQGL
jgi:hypothetical protein